MRSPSIKNKGSDVRVIFEMSALYKFDGTNIEVLDIPPFNGVCHDFTAPLEDCYLICVFDSIFEGAFDIVRVGSPSKILFVNDTQPREFTQYDTSGTSSNYYYSEILVKNIYYVKLLVHNTAKGYLSVLFSGNYIKIPFSFPYPNEGTNILIPTTGVILANSNFMDTTNILSTFGFTGSRHSFFDIDAGVWVEDIAVDAKAVDLIKAIAYKYNLSMVRGSTTFIGQYIKYIQTYDEEIGTGIAYIVGVTPDDDPNNFTLVSDDEYGSLVVRGIDMFALNGLEYTPDGSFGIKIPFNNDGMV